MTNTTLQHAPEDVKIAASFMQQQPLDPTLEARVEASGLAYMLLRRAERAEQQLVVQTLRADYEESAYCTLLEIANELDQGCSWLVSVVREIEDTATERRSWAAFHRLTKIETEPLPDDGKDALSIMGACLDIAERQRKIAETETAGLKQAVARFHRKAQRYEQEALAEKTENIKLRAQLNDLAAATVAALEDSMDGEEHPHADVAAAYSLAYAITQGGE